MAKQVDILVEPKDANTVELRRAIKTEKKLSQADLENIQNSSPTITVHLFDPDDLQKLREIDVELSRLHTRKSTSFFADSLSKFIRAISH